MVNSIVVNGEVLEMMLVFWEMASHREKVSEPYIIEVAQRAEMQWIYHKDFTAENARRVLSAIINNELLNNAGADEKKFWNNNMWMMEDLGVTKQMMAPIKHLNVDHLKESIGQGKEIEKINIIFVPGTSFDYMIREHNLIINFFKIAVDIFGGTGKITLFGKDFDAAIEGLLEETAESL